MDQNPKDPSARQIDNLTSIDEQLRLLNEQMRTIVHVQDTYLQAYRRSEMTKKPVTTIFFAVAGGLLASSLFMDLMYWLFAPQLIELTAWRLTTKIW